VSRDSNDTNFRFIGMVVVHSNGKEDTKMEDSVNDDRYSIESDMRFTKPIDIAEYE
jgi:hypothetical protein